MAGKAPDPALGEAGKQRSVHNNYLTLPVVFLMISNHYPLLYATRYNWLIVAIVLAIGPLIRHFFNCPARGQGQPVVDLGPRRRRHGGNRLAVGGRTARAHARRVAACPAVRRGRGDHPLPLQHVPCAPSRCGPARGAAARRRARHARITSDAMRG